MNIDAGNLSAVARVTSSNGRQHDAIVDLEKSGDEGPIEIRAQSDSHEQHNDKDDEDELPFSKIRSAFFVLSLTGSAFLNVCYVYESESREI
jgi:hypothetical protein